MLCSTRAGAGARSRSGSRAGLRVAVSWRYRWIMTEILRLALFALSLDLILGYAGIVSLGHAAFFGVGAYSAGLLALHGIVSVGGGAGGGRVCRRRGRLPDQLPGDPRRRPDPPDGDARDRSAAGSAGGTFLDITGGTDGLQGIAMQPFLGLFAFDMSARWGSSTALWCCLLFLLARRIVHSPFGLSLRAIRNNSLRGGRDRHSRQPPPDRGLHAGGVLCRNCRRAVHPDHGAGVARRILVRALGRPDAGAGDRRRGYLYGGLIGAVVFRMLQEFFSNLGAAILAVLDRPRIGRDRAGWTPAAASRGALWAPNLVIRLFGGGKTIVAVGGSDAP